MRFQHSSFPVAERWRPDHDAFETIPAQDGSTTLTPFVPEARTPSSPHPLLRPSNGSDAADKEVGRAVPGAEPEEELLELLDNRWTIQRTADAAGTFPREVRRVGRRYLQRGLEAALSEDPRPKPPKKFDARSEAALRFVASRYDVRA